MSSCAEVDIGVGAPWLVRIGVCCKRQDRIGANVEASRRSALDIAKNALDEGKVRLLRVVHEETHTC
jgi:hypothetical protein